MIEKDIKSHFPSQIADNATKISAEYGLSVAKAIEHEWFSKDAGGNRFDANKDDFHKLRLYARGEQPIEKYKNELSINGDLSYLNLDWKPVPIIPKFVDIVVNGIAERTYDIKAYSQDPFGLSKRTSYMEGILQDMRMGDINNMMQESFGMNMFNNDPSKLPEDEDELAVHMQLDYKQSVELAEEQAINTIFDDNKYELTKKRLYYDLTTIGIAAVKSNFTQAEGIKVEYVDPANVVYSYSTSPYFDDLYYVGEVKSVPINELVKEFPNLTVDELEDIKQQGIFNNNISNRNLPDTSTIDNNIVQILYFSYKSYINEVYKVKTTGSGADKALEKDDNFNPPESDNFSRISRPVEVLFEGAYVVGKEKLLKWGMAKNMMRPKSDSTKVKLNYSLVAPRVYKGRIESLVKRITGFADMIQLTHLKIQQVLARMVPDGVYLDADGLAEVDLGNGTNYNPQEALNMFFQTGSIIGRSLTSEGDMNPGKIPIQEIQSGSGSGKLQNLIQTYNYYLQMIRDVTGLNEARDAAMPDKNALVGIQKMAAANSNTATRHILQSGLFLTAEVAECISLRVSDIIEYSPAKQAFIQKIGGHNVATLEEMKELHLYDFGIFIELEPDEEEKQMLENNIQVALSKENIELEDAIDVRSIKNVKLANQVLKIRRKRKIERDQAQQQQNIQAQSQANAEAQQVAAQAEVQKQQALTESKIQLAQAEAQMESNKLQQEAALKKELMDHEFQINMRLKEMELESAKEKETAKEDRKDERTRIQASQQSEMIDQRNKDKAPKKFESANNDVISGDFDLGAFDPR
jgi:hypothetical protein